MTISFTPKPWDWMWVSANASGGGHLYLIDGNDRKIAALWGGADEKVANAKLIAHAPELFEYVESSAHNGCATAAALVASIRLEGEK